MSFKEWIISLFSSNPNVSSKRVFGAIGFLAALSKLYITGDIPYAETVLYVSAAMLGLETVMNVFKKKSNEEETK